MIYCESDLVEMKKLLIVMLICGTGTVKPELNDSWEQ